MTYKTIDPSDFKACIVGVPFWSTSINPAQIAYDDIEKINQKYVINPDVENNGVNSQGYVGIIIADDKESVEYQRIDFEQIEAARREIIAHVFEKTGITISPSIYFESSHVYNYGY